MLPKGTYQAYSAPPPRIILLEPDGSEHSLIEFLSAENPDTLRGDAVNFVVADEAARMVFESWVSIMTTLTKTHGRAIVISTPKGRGWFYDAYLKGEKLDSEGKPKYSALNPDPFPEWYSVRLPTWVNPTVPLESIEEMKRNMPEDVFRQEVAAVFLRENAGVFKGVKECETGQFKKSEAGHQYIMGVDLARVKDYTALIVVDRQSRSVVHLDRFTAVEWVVQKNSIIETSKAYNDAMIAVDATGAGQPIVEDLIASGRYVQPYTIGGSTAKQILIDKLRVGIEQKRITFPYHPVLHSELEDYEYQISPSGVVKYSAPPGRHDDTVVACALANYWLGDGPLVYKFINRRGV